MRVRERRSAGRVLKERNAGAFGIHTHTHTHTHNQLPIDMQQAVNTRCVYPLVIEQILILHCEMH